MQICSPYCGLPLNPFSANSRCPIWLIMYWDPPGCNCSFALHPEDYFKSIFCEPFLSPTRNPSLCIGSLYTFLSVWKPTLTLYPFVFATYSCPRNPSFSRRVSSHGVLHIEIHFRSTVCEFFMSPTWNRSILQWKFLHVAAHIEAHVKSILRLVPAPLSK